MTKFNTKNVTVARRTGKSGMMGSTGQRIATHEGGVGFKQNAESEFFRLAALNMGSDTFYESGESRDNRARTLLLEIVAENPGWVAGFVPFLRGYEQDGQIIGMNMRRSSVMTGIEYGVALNDAHHENLQENERRRAVLASALKRADEPAEALAYYMSKYGRNLPMWVKRGVGDAVQRLYTQYTALKYNGENQGFRMGDVIQLVHPIPRDEEQSNLFRYLVYQYQDPDLSGLDMIRRRRELDRLPMDQRRALLGTDALKNIGATWEWISGWVPTMDASIWEQVIPDMGYMALLRNLRNFEEKGVRDDVLEQVAQRLMDPAQVARSRQFPYQFLSAYREVSGTQFVHPLEKALNLSVGNIPALSGRTLILQDTSASMQNKISDKSKMSLQDAGAVFGAALANRGNDVDWVLYASSHEYFEAKKSILRTLDEVKAHNGRVGHGTETFQTLAKTYKNHDRVIIITDEQAFPYSAPHSSPYYNAYGRYSTYGDASDYKKLLDSIKAPIYTFDVAGYEATHIEDKPNRYILAGLTDTTFSQIKLLESGQEGRWPWL